MEKEALDSEKHIRSEDRKYDRLKDGKQKVIRKPRNKCQKEK